MKRIVLLLLAVGQITTAQTVADDHAAVMQSVLTFYAGSLELPHHLDANRKSCVDPKLMPPRLSGKLAEWRQTMYDMIGRSALPDGSIGPFPERPPDAELDRRVRLFLWKIDPDTQTAEDRAAQDAAFALAAGKPATVVPRVRPQWLKGRQVLARQQAGCEDQLKFSTPEIHGDHAFLSVEQQCGALCGLSARLMLRKREGAWHVEGSNIHHIS